MKKILVLALVALVLAAVLVGCGEKDEDIPEEATTVSTSVTVAVDTSELTYGRLTIFNGVDFVHVSNVVDYAEGDPENLDPYHYDVVGIYAIQQQGSSDVTNEAILADGSIVTLDTSLRLLPREGASFILKGRAEDEYKIILSLGLDNDEYAMSIVRPGRATETVNHVLDAWKAHDTIYWLVGETVCSLNWWDPEAEPEIYFEGANGVSHQSDEAEGALVPLSEANYKAYGREDIFSPYKQNKP